MQSCSPSITCGFNTTADKSSDSRFARNLPNNNKNDSPRSIQHAKRNKNHSFRSFWVTCDELSQSIPLSSTNSLHNLGLYCKIKNSLRTHRTRSSYAQSLWALIQPVNICVLYPFNASLFLHFQSPEAETWSLEIEHSTIIRSFHIALSFKYVNKIP